MAVGGAELKTKKTKVLDNPAEKVYIVTYIKVLLYS